MTVALQRNRQTGWPLVRHLLSPTLIATHLAIDLLLRRKWAVQTGRRAAGQRLETGSWCLTLVSPFLALLWDAFGVTQAECELWAF